MALGSDLEVGRSAYAQAAWRTAFDSLSAADRAGTLEPPDLELLARSAYMLGVDDEYVEALERAHQAYADAGDGPGAARCAIWIGHNMLFRGATARASGWFGRADRLLQQTEDCVEHGYVLIPVWLAQMGSGDYEAGLATTISAEQIGERFDDRDLVWLARDEQGRALVHQGRVSEGLRLVDETLVAATSGELSPIITGILYCNTIAFCRDVYQLRNAREWTEALTGWCERQPEMVAHNGLCLVHRAEILQLQGAWADALHEARRAAERFTQGALNQISCGQAHYRQGEIHRLRGEVTAAEDAYREASRCGREPQPGLALLRLAEGKATAAAAAIRRAVGETTDPLRRADLLPAYVEIMLEIGDVDAARTAARELGRIAEDHDSEVLSAMAAHADGNVTLVEGDAAAALVKLRRALAVWQQLDALYDTARVRVLVGLACRMLGDEDAATFELEAAHGVFERLGAAPDLARTDGPSRRAAPTQSHGLTDREVEVLRRVATGRSNREIAMDLVISEHTVARHLQNIFAKLGVSSRTAASSFAHERKLV